MGSGQLSQPRPEPGLGRRAAHDRPPLRGAMLPGDPAGATL